MKQKNMDIRLAATGSGVKLWQIAEALGVTDATLSRKLRQELSEKEKEKVLSIIQEISDQNED